ncbi:uncharacterized protein VP01_2240g1 [Puccinia sorghi]|uniref:Uncharacterized protein n=1 Tax=Puccinia sorghi TaxID=27349 RepID=A0A0L6V8K0_9BASI|nr:uncharacterized protein VP01_2240g1 [Puccinia sorghi]
MSRRIKSSNQVDRFEVPPKQIHTTHLNGVQWPSIPDILVIPKPIGPRRILTALHTALSRPITKPQFVPIATSPSSPGTPHYLSSTSHPLGSSQLGKASPANNYLGGTDFETAAENHLTNEANLRSDTQNLARPPSVHNLTSPGLRTPGTAPGTPGVPSPALLSSEALEYSSKAATENGRSSSTVVLQSPDGRPQAMFFHHSGSCNRLRSNLINHSIHGAMQSSNMGGSISSKLKLESRSSSSRPMLRKTISTDRNPEPMTLAQQVMTNAEGSNDPTKSNTSTVSTQNPLSQSVRANNSTTNLLLGALPIVCFHTRWRLLNTKPFHPGRLLYRSLNVCMPLTRSVIVLACLTPLTKEQQQIFLNPRPLQMLRMPSSPANLTTSISVTIPSPCRLPGSQFPSANEAMSSGKSRPQNSPPVQTHRPASEEAHNVKKGLHVDSMIANRLGRRRVSRKSTTALVPPINVLIVEAWLEKKLLEWSSMEWLSGFSRPNIPSNITLNHSLPAYIATGYSLPPGVAFNGTGFYEGADGKPIMSFTGTLAHIKAKEVTDHLHLRSDKAQGVRVLREKARLVSTRDMAQENSSDLSGTDDQKRALMISKAVLGAHPLPLPTQQRESREEYMH